MPSRLCDNALSVPLLHPPGIKDCCRVNTSDGKHALTLYSSLESPTPPATPLVKGQDGIASVQSGTQLSISASLSFDPDASNISIFFCDGRYGGGLNPGRLG